MAEFIEREAFVHRLMAQAVTDGLYGMGMKMGFDIAAQIALEMPRREIPAADEVERRRGRWIRDEDEYCYWYVCSECGYDTLKAGHSHDWGWRSDFCPNCGADMREVTE